MSCHRALRTRRFVPKARPSLITCHTLALLAPRHEGSSFCGGLLPFVSSSFLQYKTWAGNWPLAQTPVDGQQRCGRLLLII